MFIIPRHDGKSNVMASAAQTHISHPPIANSACVASILNLILSHVLVTIDGVWIGKWIY
jgi:hypothetical protein